MFVLAVRNSLRVSRLLSGNRSFFTKPIQKSFTPREKNTIVARSFYVLSRNKDLESFGKVMLSNTYISSSRVHSKGDEELVAFLKDEVENEKKSEKTYDPSKLNDYQVEFNEAEITLTKKFNNEIIKITSNVNNSVDAEDTVLEPNDTKEPQEAEMMAKPEFTIEITKGTKILSFHCTFNQTMPEEESGTTGTAEPYNDIFQISEISIHEGEFKDHTYTVSGDIMDGYLYDLLMNYLEERGISNDFAEKMITFFTSYEHKLYISLLQKMTSFVEK